MKIVQGSLFFLYFLLLESCDSSNQNRKKRTAQNFINTIDATLDSFTSTGVTFGAYFEAVKPIAEQDPDSKLDRNKIDSLKNYYHIYMNSLAEGISKLSNLNEFDTSLKVIKPCLYFLKNQKDAYSKTLPSWFKVYELGWDKASDSDKLIMLTTPKILRDADLSSSKEIGNMDTIVDQFKRKYDLKIN